MKILKVVKATACTVAAWAILIGSFLALQSAIYWLISHELVIVACLTGFFIFCVFIAYDILYSPPSSRTRRPFP